MRQERQPQSLRIEAPLAFDLSLEERVIHNSLFPEKAKAGFEERVIYCFMEYFANVPKAPFSYKVKREQGEVALFSQNYDVPMREHYFQAALDMTKPRWYQNRSRIEYQAFCLLEHKLSEAKPGDLFVWPSPPPFEQSEEERAKNGLGRHSFIFVFRLERDSQGERVNCFALRNYLDKEGLGQLLSQTDGGEVMKEGNKGLALVNAVRKP